MPHTPTDMSKWWTGSSCKLCQKLVISLFQSKIADVPAGCCVNARVILLATLQVHAMLFQLGVPPCPDLGPGWGVPHPADVGVPHPVDGGYPILLAGGVPGTPHPDLGWVTPILTWEGGTPILTWEGGTPNLTWEGGTPVLTWEWVTLILAWEGGTPILTWEGVTLHSDLGWGTPILTWEGGAPHFDLGCSTPTPSLPTSEGYPQSYLGGVTPPPILARLARWGYFSPSFIGVERQKPVKTLPSEKNAYLSINFVWKQSNLQNIQVRYLVPFGIDEKIDIIVTLKKTLINKLPPPPPGTQENSSICDSITIS